MKTAKQLSTQLARNVEAVVMHLLPRGKRQGHEWCAGSTSGEEGFSLKVHLVGDKAGVWCDFSTGESGDLLDLWASIRGRPLSEIMLEVKKWLGVDAPEFLPRARTKFQKPTAVVETLQNEKVLAYLTQERKLSLEIISKFKLGANDKDEIIFPFYRGEELINLKYLAIVRDEGKKKISVAKNCEPILFGWQAVDKNSRTVCICEGELDAMALAQYGINALSIPFGVNNDKWIECDFENLELFDEIFLCMDNDDAGKKAALAFSSRLGNYRCRIVTLPHKDANECLQNNLTLEEILKCFDESVSIDPAELKGYEKFREETFLRIYSSISEKGYHSPFEKSRNKIIFRPGDLSVWSGINGHGKSQFLGQLTLSFMQQGAKICFASLEMRPDLFLARLTRQTAGLELPSEEYFKQIFDWYVGKGWLFNLVGTAKRERLLEVFLYAKQKYNIDVFVIDSLLKCGLSEEDYEGQKLFVERLCDFKNEHNVHIHLVAHPRKAEDELTPPNKMQVRGSAAITDLADNVFTIWRNKEKEIKLDNFKRANSPVPPDIENLHDALWICNKQRNGDWEKAISLWFDVRSYQFLNSRHDKPISFVQFNKPRAIYTCED